MTIHATETTMGAAMRRASVNDAPARLMTLAVKCLRDNDGDVARAQRELYAAACDDPDLIRAAFASYVRSVADSMAGKDLRGGGQDLRADTGRTATAATTQPNERQAGQSMASTKDGRHSSAGWRSPLAEDDGQGAFAVNGQTSNATSSAPQREMHGQHGFAADSGQYLDAEPSPALKDPNPPRGADVIARIQPAIGKSMFDRWKLADGTPWSAVCYRELFGLARDGGIASLLLKEIPQPRDDGTRLPELLSETRFAQIVATAGGRAA